jgi:hypothetical protein
MAAIVALGTVYLEAGDTSVEFDTSTSAIGTDYKHLQLRISHRSSYGGSYGNPLLRFGTGGGSVDTGSNYARFVLVGRADLEEGDRDFAQTGIILGDSTASDAPVTDYASTICDISDYRNANKHTTTLAWGVSALSLSSNNSSKVQWVGGLWDNGNTTCAVTTVQVSQMYGANWTRGTEISLYGMKGTN